MRDAFRPVLGVLLLLGMQTPQRARAQQVEASPRASAEEEEVVDLDADEKELAKVLPGFPSRAQSEPGGFGEFSLGTLVAASSREAGTGGLDAGFSFGAQYARLRIGGEIRYTFLGGFDSYQDNLKAPYRIDLGPYFAGSLYKKGALELWLGTRIMFSRAGTYRREQVDPGTWECYGDTCTNSTAEYQQVPFKAFFGFTPTVDLTATFKWAFLRFSFLQSHWLWDHATRAPGTQRWFHVALGFGSASGALDVKGPR